MKKLKQKLIFAKEKFSKYIERNWENTNRPVYIAAMVLVCLVAGISSAQLFPMTVLPFIVGAILAFVIVNLATWLLTWGIKLLLKNGISNLIYIALIFSAIISLCQDGGLGKGQTYNMIFGAIFALALLLFVKAVWAFFRNKVHSITVTVTGIVSAVVLVSGLWLLFGDGFKDDYVDAYLELNETSKPKVSPAFANESLPGEYTVASLEYSPTKDVELTTQTIDLSFCATNPDGLEGVWRDVVTGYDVSQAPVAGIVYYPEEKDDCPVLFIVHGNHSVLEDSYLGYDYLGEYLASHGYVVVSVDENVLNQLSGENDARAILLLENIKEVLTFDNEEGNPLYGKIDEEELAIAGHSRGGEIVATAYLFNDYAAYPENGMRSFNYHFSIQSVIAIAPTVDQYMPADHEVELTDVNYLLLQGANDQDVNVFMGNTQYENISFTGDEDNIKSSLYISGANHGQFNSRWGTYDLPSPVAEFLNVENLIPETEQQDILKIFTKVFLDQTILGKKTYSDLLTNYDKYQEYLPETVYVQQYQLSHAQILCDYEEDSDLRTATDEKASLSAHNMRLWTEEMARFSNESGKKRKNYVLRLKWQDTFEASYDIHLNQELNINGKGISFDISDQHDAQVEEENYENSKPVIQVFDGKTTASVDAADYVTIYPALPVKLGKTQYLTNDNEYKHQFQTVSIPAEAFKEANPEIDMSKISSIEIAFPYEDAGIVNIDNICIQ